MEARGISEQTPDTLVRFRWYFLWIFIGSLLSVSELEYFLSVENIEISLYAQARQSLLLLTQGNIYNRLRFLNKYPGCRVSRHVERKFDVRNISFAEHSVTEAVHGLY